MTGFWFVGFIFSLIAAIFYAGMDTKIFYGGAAWRKQDELNSEKIFGYVVVSFVVALLWMFIIPVYCIFMLGRKFGTK